MKFPYEPDKGDGMKSEDFRAIVEKRRRGIGPVAWRLLFRFIAFFYGIGVRVHHRLFDLGLRKVRRLDVPVISVGNLTLGGTGKTPMVAWLTRVYRDRNAHPALLSRGYHASRQMKETPIHETDGDGPEKNKGGRVPPYSRQNDEAAELAIEFPDITHFQSPDRFHAGKALLDRFPQTDRFLLDDAFQHRKLFRDLNILLLDSLDPFGREKLFPAGFLREPLSALRRADVVILSRADLVSPERRNDIRRTVERFAPDALWGETAPVPTALVHYEPDRAGTSDSPFISIPFDPLPPFLSKETSLLPFCGIGNPEGFFQMIRRAGLKSAPGKVFSDHHQFTPADLTELDEMASRLNVPLFLTTMKDLVKIRRKAIGNRPVYGVKIGLTFLSGEEALLQRLP